VTITAIAVAMIRAPLLSVCHGGKLEQSASGGQNSGELSARTDQRLCGPNGRLEERESSSLSTVGAQARSSTLRQLMSALVPCVFPLLFNGVVRIRVISMFSDFMRCHHRIYIEATPKIAHAEQCVDQVIAKFLSQVADVYIDYIAGWIMA